MIKAIAIEDYNTFMELGTEFYNSSAVEDKISRITIKNTFKHIVNNSPYIKGFLIYVGNQIAGFFTISFGFATEFGGKIMLFEDLYIKEEFQNNGLGTEIFTFVEENYRNDIKVIKLEVAKDNKRALELYRSLGYYENKYISMLKKV